MYQCFVDHIVPIFSLNSIACRLIRDRRSGMLSTVYKQIGIKKPNGEEYKTAWTPKTMNDHVARGLRCVSHLCERSKLV